MLIIWGEKLGEGGCSEVFDAGEGRVVKLAKANTSLDALKKEYHNNLAAWENGLPAPRPYGLVERDHRPGLVLEHIAGETLRERLQCNVMGHVEEYCRITARVLSQVHKGAGAADQFPSQLSSIRSGIRWVGSLGEEEKEAVISMLERLPVKQCFCHGDPNPSNIIVRQDGSAVLIDWMNATIGNPEADLAEFIIMIRYAVLPSDTPAEFVLAFDEVREIIIQIFMEEYTLLTGIGYSEVEPWIVPMAARKLRADGICEAEKNKLAEVIRQSLQ